MQFITSGNRIAVENFVLGDLYTITFTNGTYINSACIGIGDNFVTFQRNEPELLFTLTMATAELVSSIELYSGGTGTNSYNDLTNKPQINDVELVGNKSLSDLGIQATISDIDTIRSGAAAGATAVQPSALADYQPVISDLDTIRSGAAAGATAVQPAALSDYQPIIDSSHMLDADLVDDTTATHKFATAAQLSQIETNKNNISYYQANGSYNKLRNSATTQTISGTTFTVNSDGTVDISGKPSSGNAQIVISDLSELENGKQYTFFNGGTVQESTNIYFGLLGASGVPNLIVPPNGVTITLDKTQYLSAIIRVTSSSPITAANFKPMATEGTITHSYEQYALSNAELTAAIQALQAQLANQ